MRERLNAHDYTLETFELQRKVAKKKTMSLGLISYEDDDDYHSLQKLSYPEGARRKANQKIGVRLSFGSTSRSWREKLGGWESFGYFSF